MKPEIVERRNRYGIADGVAVLTITRLVDAEQHDIRFDADRLAEVQKHV